MPIPDEGDHRPLALYLLESGGQPNRNLRSSILLTLDDDAALMLLDDGLANTQAQPCPLLLCGEKGFKESLATFFGDACPSVDDIDLHHVLGRKYTAFGQ